MSRDNEADGLTFWALYQTVFCRLEERVDLTNLRADCAPIEREVLEKDLQRVAERLCDLAGPSPSPTVKRFVILRVVRELLRRHLDQPAN